VLAAGFDSTAYRFARPGVKFFELDLPHASQRKRELVDACLPDRGAHPRPAYIAADLAAVPLGEALAGSRFDPAAPTLWLAQGLTYYVSIELLSILPRGDHCWASHLS
jgi:O-methyltransferase involved in polyketide biosynthesis